MSTEAFQHELERACEALRVPALHQDAEAALSRLKKSEHALPSCIDVLQRTASPDACFQAAIMLRDLVLLAWNTLSQQQRCEIQRWVLDRVLESAKKDSGPGLHAHCAPALSSLIFTHALLLKRQWLDCTTEQQQQVLRGICVCATQQQPVQVSALRVLSAVVAEFNVPTATPVGMGHHLHCCCAEGLERAHLRQLLELALWVMLQMPLDATLSLAPQAAGTATAALTLALKLVSWDFARTAKPSQRRSRSGQSASLDDGSVPLLYLPADWLPLLTSDAVQQWLGGAVARFGVAVGQIDAEILGDHLRDFMLQLSCVRCKQWPSGPNGGEFGKLLCGCMHAAATLMEAVTGLLREDAAADLDPLAGDAARVALAVAGSAAAALEAAASGRGEASGAQAALQQLAGPGLAAFQSALVNCSRAAILAGWCKLEHVDAWQGQCFGLLLETWCLVHPALQAAAGPGNGAAGPTAQLLAELIAAHQHDLAAGAEDDGVDAMAEEAARPWEDDALVRMAGLARTALSSTLPMISRVLVAEAEAFVLPGPTPAATLEQLWGFMRLAAALVADPSGAGESPSVPEEIVQHCGASSEAAHELWGLFAALQQVAHAVTRGDVAAHTSARLMAAIVAALSRYLDTYLLPPHCPQPVQPLAADPNVAPDLALRLVSTALTAFPDPEVHSEAITLLQVVASSAPRRHALTAKPAWAQLVDAFAGGPGGVGVLQRLHGKQQRALARALCLSAAGPTVSRLVHPTVQLVLGLGAADAREAAAAATTDATEQVAVALERLRGAAEGVAVTCSSPLLFSAVQPCLLPLLRVQQRWSHNALVSALLFKFATALVDSQLALLDLSKAKELATWCLDIVCSFGSWMAAQPRGRATSTSSDAQLALDESCKHVKALLKLLLALARHEDDRVHPHMASVIFQGVHVLMSAISEGLLQRLNVQLQYFALVALLCNAFTRELAVLQQEHFTLVLHSLGWGLEQPMPTTATASLNAIEDLAAWHLQELQAGRVGLTEQVTPDGQRALCHMVRVVLLYLIKQVSGEDTVQDTARAVLTMLLADPDAFVRAVDMVLGAHVADAAAQQRLMHMAKDLASASVQPRAGGASVEQLQPGFSRQFSELVNMARRLVLIN